VLEIDIEPLLRPKQFLLYILHGLIRIDSFILGFPRFFANSLENLLRALRIQTIELRHSLLSQLCNRQTFRSPLPHVPVEQNHQVHRRHIVEHPQRAHVSRRASLQHRVREAQDVVADRCSPEFTQTGRKDNQSSAALGLRDVDDAPFLSQRKGKETQGVF
jgi:hypothetical protein